MSYYESIEITYPEEKVSRKTYHVVSSTTSDKERVWKVKLAGKSTVSNGLFKSKSEAVARAKELGKKANLGQVVIHKLDGTIQTEYTYGDDPVKTKG